MNELSRNCITCGTAKQHDVLRWKQADEAAYFSDWITTIEISSAASTKIYPTYGSERAWHFNQEKTFLEYISPF